MKYLPFFCLEAALFINDFRVLCIIYPRDNDVPYLLWLNNDKIDKKCCKFLMVL